MFSDCYDAYFCIYPTATQLEREPLVQNNKELISSPIHIKDPGQTLAKRDKELEQLESEMISKKAKELLVWGMGATSTFISAYTLYKYPKAELNDRAAFLGFSLSLITGVATLSLFSQSSK